MQPATSETVIQWMDHLADGNNEVADKIWNDYFGKMVKIARKKLGSVPRRDADEEDVALSAMNSFFQGLTHRKFDLHHRDDLWKLLVTITARKATAKRRKFFAQKRGSGKVRGESIFGHPEDQSHGISHVLGTEPTPELAVSVAENCNLLLDQLQDETLRQVALWILEGYSSEEIAKKMGCVRRTVERKLARIREIWESLLPS